MRAVIQRVKKASVEVEGKVVGQIQEGVLVFLGITHTDTDKQSEYIINKLLNMRLFENEKQQLDKSVKDVGGGVLVVSQFTLYANTKKGRRPSFEEAAKPDEAERLYDGFVERLKGSHSTVETGRFGAKMAVSLENDGPVTIILEQ